MDGGGMLQIFARLVNGKTAVLRFSSDIVNGYEVKEKIFHITGIPPSRQRLISNGYQLGDQSVISVKDTTVNIALRLPGGKGGFGSLLRGAATKAGHKKTNNFDACRDMSGRRLRHVNAEKMLEEWKAGEEKRKLEKLAEDYLKSEAKKRGGNKMAAAERAAEKYVTGYREQSAKCVGAVEEAVKDASHMILKRKSKSLPSDISDSKKLKIWMGKRKLGESDGEYSSDDEKHEDGTKESIVTSINCNDKVEVEGSSDSVTGNSEGNENTRVISELGNSIPKEETEICNDEIDSGLAGNSEIEEVRTECMVDNVKESSIRVSDNTDIEVVMAMEDAKSINLEDYSSASDLEVIGLKRLKNELSSRGLKCGGTLQERAARLFLLKTIAFHQLPKKIIARK